MTKFNRRQTLGLLAGGAAAGACNAPEQERSETTPSSSTFFQHGVASGDPAHESVVLWTRITTDARSETVDWLLAEDEALTTIVASGQAQARAENDHTLKIIPTGLKPGHTYYFGFAIEEERSPVGRTKTLPDGALDRLGIALASCSNYAFGHFNAYDAIATDEAVDIVLHTGDYIYEYGVNGWGGETSRVLGRPHDPPHEIVTLDDYRRRHAQYKTDPGSQAVHAAHPFITCWDDHESTNNPWMDGAQNHQPDTEGDWDARRAASLQAYYEWMPIRDPEPGMTRAEYWRSYRFGDLASLVTLETRHTARGEQVDYAAYIDEIETDADRDAFMRNVIGDAGRKMLSEKMEDALRDSLSASKRDGQPWRIIGNPCPIARMLVPNIVEYGISPEEAPAGETPGAGANLLWKGQWNLPFYTDTWDGYPAAREAFYKLCQDAGVTDLLVLTGDSHSFWANELYDESGHSMGLEIGTAGISSPGDFVETGWDLKTAARLDRIFEEAMAEVRWTDNLHQGYVRVVLSPEKADVDFIAVSTVLMEDTATSVLRSETVRKNENTLIYSEDI